MSEIARGKFVEVLRRNSRGDSRTSWKRGLIVAVGPGDFSIGAQHYQLNEHELLVKISNGHAMAETVEAIDRRHDTWRLLFK